MTLISDEQVSSYVQAHISEFHDKRLHRLRSMDLEKLLRRKNPYLFRSKDVVSAEDLVGHLLDAHLSSQEETLFGQFLEGLAIHVAERVYGGQKSGISGIDLEFVKDGRRFLVSIKSGPNWGNSAQVANMKLNFQQAKRRIRQDKSSLEIIAVNGCCYGRDRNPDKGEYFKYCGQEFWALLSGDDTFFTRIIEPLGHNAKRQNERFATRYAALKQEMAQEFKRDFCRVDGTIDWPRLVGFSSARDFPG